MSKKSLFWKKLWKGEPPDESTEVARQLVEMLRSDIDDFKIMKKYWFFRCDKSIRESLMVFGFECDKGWYSLIDNFCKELKKLIESKYPEYKTGELQFEIIQVKEKYGRLCIYTNFSNDDIDRLIEKYEELSQVTCEMCGNRGKLRKYKGWYKTLCDKCYKKWKEEF